MISTGSARRGRLARGVSWTLPRLPLVLLLIAVCASPLAAQRTGTLRGHVRLEGSGAAVPGALVEVLGRPGAAGVADARGAYTIHSVPAGRHVVRARHIGHAALEVEVMVPAGGTVALDLSLRLEPIVLAPVDVSAGRAALRPDTLSAQSPALGLAEARVLGSSPGFAELGIADAVQRIPGQEPPDPNNVLYVRGAAADLKLVFLDGAPVYAPFPLGGLIDAFTPGALGAADVFLGGAPARYDGGLSYVMDLRTRGVRNDAFRTTGAVDLLSARAAVELPVAPGVAVFAAARGVHGAGTIEPLPYGYGEGLLRADVALPGGATMLLTGFRNSESVVLERRDPRNRVEWGNTAGSVRFAGPLAGGEAEITASAGGFAARLPLDSAGHAIDGESRRVRIAADLARSAGGLRVRYGASVDRLTHAFEAELRDGAGARARAVGDAAGAYVDLSFRPAERVRVRGGLRADYFAFGHETALAPRLAVTYLASDRAALTIAGGRYHQYVRASEAEVLFPTEPDSLNGSPTAFSVAGATHLAASLDQELGEGLRLGLEGFFKSFEGVAIAGADRASASGMDLWLRRTAGRVTGWGSYSLAWIWSGGGADMSQRFAGRHLLSGGVATPVGARARIEASFSYGSGLPYAAIPLFHADAPTDVQVGATARLRAASYANSEDAAPLLPAPDKPFLRLDLTASHTWTGSWAGRPARLSSYLKLLNTLGQRDALFYRYDEDESLRALAAIPVVPVLGIEWTF